MQINAMNLVFVLVSFFSYISEIEIFYSAKNLKSGFGNNHKRSQELTMAVKSLHLRIFTLSNLDK